MSFMANMDIDTLFDGVFNKLSSPEFGKKLGGELPLYIQPIPADLQPYVGDQIKRLSTRLQKKGKETISINLYDLCMDILQEEGVLETILEEEQNLSKDDIISTLDSVLDIKSVVIPRIKAAIDEAHPTFLFINGVGSVYPFVRSHGILNNIDELTGDCNLILFFPGDYDNLQLKLFGTISDENYYRGHNLNDLNE
jgi:hypothetical protein